MGKVHLTAIVDWEMLKIIDILSSFFFCSFGAFDLCLLLSNSLLRDKTYITILRQLLLDHHLSSNKKFRYSASNKELSGENGMDCSGRKHTYKSFYNYWSKYLFKNVNITWSMAVSRDQWFQYTKLMAPISRSTNETINSLGSRHLKRGCCNGNR